MGVPFIDLSRTIKRYKNKVLEDWAACLDNGWLVGGEPVKNLEESAPAIMGARNFVSCANGTDALIIGLQAMGVKPGNKVALPNLTFWATYEAVAQLGATPVLIDINRDDLQMDYDEFTEAHKQHGFSHAILVHLYGWCSSKLGEFRSFAKANNVRLLEDSAQAFGVEVGGDSIFKDADVATLSMYPAKVVGGAMDGGAILTQTKEDADLCRSLCNHGRSAHYSYAHVGWNSRMSGLQACWLKYVFNDQEFLIGTRREAMKTYAEMLEAELGNKVKQYGPPAGVTGNGYLNVIELPEPNADEVMGKLRELGVGCGRTYPESIDSQPPVKGALTVSELKFSNEFCKKVINLPMFAGITKEECAESVAALKKVL